MIQIVSRLHTTIKSLRRRNKIALLGIASSAVVLTGVVFALSPTTDVQPTKNYSQAQPQAEVAAANIQADEQATTTNESPESAAQGSSTNRSTPTTANPAGSTGSNSQSAPTQQSSTPTPQPNPAFTLTLHEGQGYKDPVSKHYIVPFTIDRENGHSAALTLSATTSAGFAGIHCSASLSGDSGKLDIWFDPVLQKGFYVCTLHVNDGKTIHSAEKAFHHSGGPTE